MLPSERTISGLEAIGLISKVIVRPWVAEAEPDMGGPQFGVPIDKGIYNSEDTVTVAATEIEIICAMK